MSQPIQPELTKGERTATRIRTAAGRLFADKSVDQVSLRAIGRAAGVDPALISHYFGSKEGLFLAVVADSSSFATIEATVTNAPTDQLGNHLLRTAEHIWNTPEGAGLIAITRRALAGDPELLRDTLATRIISLLSPRLPGDEHEQHTRASLALSHLIGLLIARHLVHVEPLASLEVDEVIAVVEPTLDRYLTGEFTTSTAPDQ